jgi:hypothetical protein
MSAAEAIRAARDAGVDIAIDDNDLLLEASAPPPAGLVDLLSRHKAEIIDFLSAVTSESDQFRIRASGPTRESTAKFSVATPGPEQPCASRCGLVVEENGALLYFCVECGRFGRFGVGVSLRQGRTGRWYCGEHRPNKKIKLGENERHEQARATEVSLRKAGE